MCVWLGVVHEMMDDALLAKRLTYKYNRCGHAFDNWSHIDMECAFREDFFIRQKYKRLRRGIRAGYEANVPFITYKK